MDQPLVEEPLSKEGGFCAEEAAGRRRGQWGRTPGWWERPEGRLHAGKAEERATPELRA